MNHNYQTDIIVIWSVSLINQLLKYTSIDTLLELLRPLKQDHIMQELKGSVVVRWSTSITPTKSLRLPLPPQ